MNIFPQFIFTEGDSPGTIQMKIYRNVDESTHAGTYSIESVVGGLMSMLIELIPAIEENPVKCERSLSILRILLENHECPDRDRCPAARAKPFLDHLISIASAANRKSCSRHGVAFADEGTCPLCQEGS